MNLTNWETSKVDKLFDLGRGRVINDDEIKKYPGPYPVFSSQTENNGCFGKVNFYEFEGEYITWTTDGANAGTVFFRDGRFNCTNVCGTLEAKNPEAVDTKLFSYLISREAYKHVAIVGNNKLMNNVMGKIKVTYPKEITEQRKIASILTKVDDAIQAVKNTIEKAERLKKSLMQNLLTGKLKPDGTWRSDDDFYEDEKFGKVPVGWEVKKWGQLISLEYGRSLNGANEGDIPVFGTNGQIGFTSKIMFDAAGIIVGRKGAYREIHYSDKPFWVIDTAFYVKPKTDFNIEWAFFALKQININVIDSGSAIPSTNKKDVYFKRVVVPQKDEQIVISNKFKSLNRIISMKRQKIERLERLKKALMQNLLTGKVRVKV